MALDYYKLSKLAQGQIHCAATFAGGLSIDGRVRGSLITGGWIELVEDGWTLTPEGRAVYEAAVRPAGEQFGGDAVTLEALEVQADALVARSEGGE